MAMSIHLHTARLVEEEGNKFPSTASVELQAPSFPVSQPRSTAPSDTSMRHHFTGWRQGALVSALCAALSLAVNIYVGVWVKNHGTFQGDIGQLFVGDCDLVASYNTWAHLGINAVSTLLLSGSNYCMQCLTSPTREDIDRAHSKGEWLDVGVSGLRNLRYVARHKVIRWWLLCLSSVPLHLMYNSAFFASLSSNDYMVYVVTEGFWTSVDPVPANAVAAVYPPQNSTQQLEEIRQSKQYFGYYENLTNSECMRTYRTDFLTDRRTLVITSSNSSARNAGFLYGYQYNSYEAINTYNNRYVPYDWICYGPDRRGDQDCNEYIDVLIANNSSWSPFGFPAQYCMSEVAEPTCSLNASLPIILVVACCNVVKLIVMFTVAFALQGQPLITVGDAVESFLQRPDPTTNGACLLSKTHVIRISTRRIWPVAAWNEEPRRKMVAELGKHRWSLAASTRRWIWSWLLVLASVACVICFLCMGIRDMRFKSTVRPFSIGFGKVHGAALIGGVEGEWAPASFENPSHQIIAAVIIANLPQAIFSLIYFNVNGIATSVYLAKEWNSFSTHRKTLRVSTPRWGQRSTYFLSLPYRIAIPLILASGIIHWLISQSIFLAVVAGYNPWGALKTPVQIVSCGYSPLAMVLTIVAAVVLMSGLSSFRWQKVCSFMPLAGSCSAAISAACHATEEDQELGLKSLQWGAVRKDGGDTEASHCCFTSADVEALVAGRRYVG